MRTIILNFIRLLFFFKPLEIFLLKKTSRKKLNSFWTKFPPNHYQYKKGSIRKVERNGINYQLDLNDIVDWTVYYDIIEPARITLFNNIKSGDIIFDIGANIGETAMNFAKLATNEGFVYSFEPDKHNYSRNLNNMSKNEFDNIELINKGMGDACGSFSMLNTKNNNAGMNKIIPTKEGIKNNSKISKIKVTTIDTFIQKNGIEKVDFIKIDVEGFEYKVLKGGENCISKFEPTFFIELDNTLLKEQNSSAKILISFLEEKKYKIKNAATLRPVTSTDNFEKCHFDIICTKGT